MSRNDATATGGPFRPAVAWLRAPARSANALLRGDPAGLLARLTLPMLTVLTLGALACVLFATTTTYTVNAGIGDDGIYYVAWMRSWSGDIHTLGLNRYAAQRSLAPLVIRWLMVTTKTPLTTESIIHWFQVIDCACVVGAFALVSSATRHFSLSRAGYLVVMVCTFFNFATLYWLPFDPVLMDAMAFFIGSVQLWAFLSRQRLLLAIVSILGGFIWPSSAHLGVCLLFFPRPTRDVEARREPFWSELLTASRPTILDSAVAALGAAWLTWFASGLQDYQSYYHFQPTARSLFRLSCAFLCVITFGMLRSLVRVVPTVRALFRLDLDAIISRALAIVVGATVYLGIGWIASYPPRVIQMPDPSGDLLEGIVYLSVQRPLGFIISHVAFYGPAIFLIMLGWPRVCDAARRLGFGLTAALALLFVLGLNSQSRGLLSLAPMLLPLAALGCARFSWTPRRLFELAVATFFASKLWFTIVQKPTFDAETIFCHVGPWMSNAAMIVQGLGAAIIAAWLLWAIQQRPPAREIVWLCEAQPADDATSA